MFTKFSFALHGAMRLRDRACNSPTQIKNRIIERFPRAVRFFAFDLFEGWALGAESPRPPFPAPRMAAEALAPFRALPYPKKPQGRPPRGISSGLRGFAVGRTCESPATREGSGASRAFHASPAYSALAGCGAGVRYADGFDTGCHILMPIRHPSSDRAESG